MLNEQLKSYTDEERSFLDGASYDQQKDLQIVQLKELLDSHQEELGRVQREAADLREQLQALPCRSPSVTTTAESRNTDKGPALNTSLSEQIDRNEELEMGKFSPADTISQLELLADIFLKL
jgi:hypothetical protein